MHSHILTQPHNLHILRVPRMAAHTTPVCTHQCIDDTALAGILKAHHSHIDHNVRSLRLLVPTVLRCRLRSVAVQQLYERVCSVVLQLLLCCDGGLSVSVVQFSIADKCYRDMVPAESRHPAVDHVCWHGVAVCQYEEEWWSVGCGGELGLELLPSTAHRIACIEAEQYKLTLLYQLTQHSKRLTRSHSEWVNRSSGDGSGCE